MLRDVTDSTTQEATEPDAVSEEWRKILTEGHKPLVRMRWLFRHLPSSPRCKMCNNPFGGVGGRIVRVAGFKPSRKNPTLCSACCDNLPARGAEVDIAVLFADVRGSTTIGEGVDPAAFAELLDRFYRAATGVLLRHDAVIDKLIGDEVMALFIPGISGPEYRRRAVDAALDVMRAVGYGSADGPWLGLGAGVNAGPAFVGNVGASGVVDFTALGDTVNVAARLQGAAAGGEVVVAAGVDERVAAGGTRRVLELRGHDAPLPTVVLTP
jgi:adenylate cyclase